MNNNINGLTDREIIVSRDFNAPRELMFEAFTHSDKIEQWWGPNGFSTTTKSMSFRVGGEWIFTMHGPDGTDYPNHIIYTDIKKPEYLKYDHYGHRNGKGDPPHFRAAITFEKLGDSTRVTLRMLFPTAEDRDKAAEVVIEGGHQTLARLEAYLTNL